MTPAKRETVLVNFLEFDGPMTIRELAEKTGRDQTGVGNGLNQLFQSGVVNRARKSKAGGVARISKRSRYVWRLA